MLKIALLGSLTAEMDGSTVRFETRKVAALLAYLILNPGGSRREKMAALLWPEYDAPHAMANLRRALGSLIHALPPEYILADRETIRWNEPGPVQIDVRDFEDRLRAVSRHSHDGPELCPACLEALETLAILYLADFLDNIALPDCLEFDGWQYALRENLRREFAWSQERLALAWASRLGWEKAAEVARCWVRQDRLDSGAQLTLIGIYARSGQCSLAQRQYDEYARLFQTVSDMNRKKRFSSSFEQFSASPCWQRESPGRIWWSNRLKQHCPKRFGRC